jgi:hypothetical protein
MFFRADLICVSHASSAVSDPALAVGKAPVPPFLQAPMTSAGPDTRATGAVTSKSSERARIFFARLHV